jgi:signal transduction histidine kinase/ligand-binding sensor domain-containing protein
MRVPQKRPVFVPLAWLLCGLTTLLPCVSAFALNPNRDLSQYAHTNWRVEDGDIPAIVNAIAQTTDGYIWIGTENGLLRFDGVRFVPWAPPAGTELPSQSISGLLVAHDGSLWIGTSVGVAHWKNGTLTRYLDKGGSVRGFAEDNAGRIWVAHTPDKKGEGPLCQLTETTVHCYGPADGISFSVITYLTADLQGNLWLASAEGMERWQPGSFDFYRPHSKKNADIGAITGVCVTADGTVWFAAEHVGSWNGLQRLVHGVIEPIIVPGLAGKAAWINDLTDTRENGIMVGTTDHGLYRINAGKVDHFDASDGLTSNYVNQSFEDNEGNLWAVTNGGIDRFSDRSVVTIASKQGLSSEFVQSVLASRRGGIWIATNEGVDLLRKGKISSIRNDKGCPRSEPTTLYEDSSGVLWMGLGGGLWIHAHGPCKAINRPDGSPLGTVEAITQDVDGSMWMILAGAPGRLIHIRSRAIVEEIVISPNVLDSPLLADPQGGVWFTLTHDKVAHYRNGNLETSPSFLGGRLGSFLYDIAVDPNGRFLAATTFGLVGCQNDKFQVLTQQNGLPCNSLYNLIFDDKGSLWLSATCGLVKVRMEDLQTWWAHPEVKLTPTILDAFDGAYPQPKFRDPSNTRSTDGKLWFDHGGALQMVDPAHLDRNNVIPPVHVEQLIANGKEYPLAPGLRLPPLLRDLEIDYAALSFVAPKKVLFRYKLENHDADWQDAGTRRQAFYEDLKPGHYTFRVIACNNSGLWNQVGDSVDFDVAPTFYQTLWFRTLMGFVAVALVWLFYLFRISRATVQIQERLGARMEERERIARELHDTLLQGFQGLMLRFQAVLNTLPKESPVREMVERALDRADEVLMEGRQRVQDLRADTMTGGDLPDHIARCGEELSQDHTIAFMFSVIGSPQALDPIVSGESYRIAREALSNAFMHSHGAKIEVELAYEPTQLSLRIRDDGVGMDREIMVSGRSGHWGIPGMRERAQKIGAQLYIFSKPASGTEVQLTIPAKVAYARGEKLTLLRRIIAFGSRRGAGA